MMATKVGGRWVFEVDGVVMNGVEAAAAHFGFNLFTLRGRIAKGWTILQCFGLDPQPPRKRSDKAGLSRWKHKAAQHAMEAETKRRVCRACRVEKPFTDYSRSTSTKHGIATTCRVCIQDKTMKRRYGIGLKEYDAMISAQGGMCAICGGLSPQTKGDRFCVDHDHKTGKVRGLLCVNCNLALGKMDDDQERIMAAIGYIRRFRK